MKRIRNIRFLFIIIAAVFAVFIFSAIAWAATNGPINSDDIGDGEGTSHTSTVYYTKQSSPFTAWVDEVYYGGRKPSNYPLTCVVNGDATKLYTRDGMAAVG